MKAVKRPTATSVSAEQQLSVQMIWKDLAKKLIREGIYTQAKQLLSESELRAEVFSDYEVQAWCLYFQAKVYFLESNYTEANKLLRRVVKLGYNPELVYKVASLASQLLHLSGDNKKAKNIILQAISCLVDGENNRHIKKQCLIYRLKLQKALLSLLLPELDALVEHQLDPAPLCADIDRLLSSCLEIADGLGRLPIFSATMGFCAQIQHELS
jgi:tetratricopeptide (TPR) repeat protein